MQLGRPADAVAEYQQVVERAGSGVYGEMARLGVAEAQVRAGQYEQAINTFKELAQRKDGALPVDAILMQLGRTYVAAGKTADAQQTFNRLVEEYPGLAVHRRRAPAARRAEEDLARAAGYRPRTSAPKRYVRIL